MVNNFSPKNLMEFNLKVFDFLDILIKTQDGKRVMEYSKYLLIPNNIFFSCHVTRKNTKSNVSFNHTKRMCTVVSEPSKREERLKELEYAFMQSAFSPSILINRRNKAKKMDINE